MKKFIFLFFVISFCNAKEKRDTINNLAYQRNLLYSSGYDGYCISTYNCKKGLVCNLSEYKCRCSSGQQYSKTLRKCVDCPNGWNLFRGKCVLVVKKTSTSWENARKTCLNAGGDLLNVEDNNFYNFWVPFAYYFKLNESSSNETIIGLRALYSTSNWAWTIDKTVLTEGPWLALLSFRNTYDVNTLILKNPPPNSNDKKTCGVVDNSILNYLVNQVNCKETRVFNYICQRSTTNMDYSNLYYERNQEQKLVPNKPKAECYFSSDCAPGSNKVCVDYKCICPSGSIWYEPKDQCLICDSGWTLNPRNGKCYFISSEDNLKTYAESVNFCANSNANLIQIDDNYGLKYPIDLFNLIGDIEWNVDFFWVGQYFDILNQNYISVNNQTMQSSDNLAWFGYNFIYVEQDQQNLPSGYIYRWSTYNDFMNGANGSEINLVDFTSYRQILGANEQFSNCLSSNANIIVFQNCLLPRRFICEKSVVNIDFKNSMESVREDVADFGLSDLLKCPEIFGP